MKGKYIKYSASRLLVVHKYTTVYTDRSALEV